MSSAVTVKNDVIMNDYTFSNMRAMCQVLAKSNFLGIKSPDEMLSLMLIARSQGQDPVETITRYHVVNGKPTLKAEAMQELFEKQGGKCEFLRLDEKVAEIKFIKSDGSTFVSKWTIEMAVRAGLAGGPVWSKYPQTMLKSRAISSGLKTFCPMLCNGFYTPEEQKEIPANTVKVVDVSEVEELVPVVKEIPFEDVVEVIEDGPIDFPRFRKKAWELRALANDVCAKADVFKRDGEIEGEGDFVGFQISLEAIRDDWYSLCFDYLSNNSEEIPRKAIEILHSSLRLDMPDKIDIFKDDDGEHLRIDYGIDNVKFILMNKKEDIK